MCSQWSEWMCGSMNGGKIKQKPIKNDEIKARHNVVQTGYFHPKPQRVHAAQRVDCNRHNIQSDMPIVYANTWLKVKYTVSSALEVEHTEKRLICICG